MLPPLCLKLLVLGPKRPLRSLTVCSRVQVKWRWLCGAEMAELLLSCPAVLRLSAASKQRSTIGLSTLLSPTEGSMSASTPFRPNSQMSWHGLTCSGTACLLLPARCFVLRVLQMLQYLRELPQQLAQGMPRLGIRCPALRSSGHSGSDEWHRKARGFQGKGKEIHSEVLLSAVPLVPSGLQRHCRTMVVNMVWAVDKGKEDLTLAMLWLASYLFLLRVPSEVAGFALRRPSLSVACVVQALPMCKCQPSSELAASKQTIIWRQQDEVCIRIRRRKNRPQGSGVIKRICTRAGSKRTCPVHALWDGFFQHLPDGTAPWELLSASYVRLRLKRILEQLGIPGAAKFGTHDFRRGHAEDLRKSGSSLAEILNAGQWQSASFMKYIEEVGLERDVAYLCAISEEEEQFVD